MIFFKQLLTLLSCYAMFQAAFADQKQDAIVIVSNHRQAVWAQMLLRDLHARDHGMATVCLLQGDLRLVDRSAFEQLCTEIFPASPLTGYNVRWQRLRVFVEQSFRNKYKRMTYVSNNAIVNNKTEFYSAIQSFNGTLGMNANVCGMSTQGRYREFRKKYQSKVMIIYMVRTILGLLLTLLRS